MKHLTIRNFGPLKDVDIDLGRINLIIGLQGSGKSCVMITACYCTWVEKRISLRQSAKEFEQGTSFLDTMTAYYRTKGYVHEDTYIGYETEFMEFSYDHSKKSFIHKWKSLRWRYKRPKVSYVPAERNMVSLVANWNRLETNYDNILDFIGKNAQNPADIDKYYKTVNIYKFSRDFTVSYYLSHPLPFFIS